MTHKKVTIELINARNLIKKLHPGNFYMEVAEMEKAICEVLNLDYNEVKTEDFETITRVLLEKWYEKN